MTRILPKWHGRSQNHHQQDAYSTEDDAGPGGHNKARAYDLPLILLGKEADDRGVKAEGREEGDECKR